MCSTDLFVVESSSLSQYRNPLLTTHAVCGPLPVGLVPCRSWWHDSDVQGPCVNSFGSLHLHRWHPHDLQETRNSRDGLSFSIVGGRGFSSGGGWTTLDRVILVCFIYNTVPSLRMVPLLFVLVWTPCTVQRYSIICGADSIPQSSFFWIIHVEAGRP